jgi:hypothetical protein
MTASNPARISEEDISARAHEIWEAEGRPEGRDREHWFRAKEEVAAGGDDHPQSSPQSAPQSSVGEDPDYVRRAGRKTMDMPPASWSKTDEEIDESFPASDPPGNY